MTRSLPAIAILTAAAIWSAPLPAQDARESTPENVPAIPALPSRPPSEMQTPPPEAADPRFAFHRIDGGFMRLDLRTGAVATCSRQADGWVCVPARDERAVLDSEIARLRRDNAALKNALLERGLPLPNDMKADAPAVPVPIAPAPVEAVPRPPQSVPPAASAPPAPPKAAEPDRASRDDAEIERIMTVMEKVWRRLVEMMMNIQRDMQKKG